MARESSTKPAVLAYWSIRAIGQPIRYLLEYIGEPYENKTYDFIDDVPGDECKTLWRKEREELRKQGLPFPNLPYYVDGKVNLTQSLAIMRYLGRTHGLYAKTHEEETQQDMLEGQVNDFRWSLIHHCKADTYESLRWNYPEVMHGQLKLFSDYLGTKKWLLGEQLCYVDFMLYEALDQHNLFRPKCLDEFSNLKAYHERFRSLPAILAYLRSERFKEWPVFGAPAKRWGWKKETSAVKAS
ncbi:glutathione S-transferase Mu 1-like [Ornithodoros turicata]|uniref:glutathione S-transferase Mu 1-like n=1 Tax=Ornithodoros turicata TaxID=34597 RepID=UPI0031394F87